MISGENLDLVRKEGSGLMAMGLRRCMGYQFKFENIDLMIDLFGEYTQ